MEADTTCFNDIGPSKLGIRRSAMIIQQNQSPMQSYRSFLTSPVLCVNVCIDLEILLLHPHVIVMKCIVINLR